MHEMLHAFFDAWNLMQPIHPWWQKSREQQPQFEVSTVVFFLNPFDNFLFDFELLSELFVFYRLLFICSIAKIDEFQN